MNKSHDNKEIREEVNQNLNDNPDHYSMYNVDNIQRCKVDRDFLGEVLLANEDLIWHSIRKYVEKPRVITSYGGAEESDLLQLGRLAFIKAIDAFDPEKGFKFSTLAVIAIVREVKCYLRDSGRVLRLSRSAYHLNCKISKLLNENGSDMSFGEIAEALETKVSEVEKVMTTGGMVMSLDNTVRGEGQSEDITYVELMPDNDTAIEEEVVDIAYIEKVLDNIREQLTPTEVTVLDCKLENMTQLKIAEEAGVSRDAVRDILKRIRERMYGELRWYSELKDPNE